MAALAGCQSFIAQVPGGHLFSVNSTFGVLLDGRLE
jgi:hypothetical protein